MLIFSLKSQHLYRCLKSHKLKDWQFVWRRLFKYWICLWSFFFGWQTAANLWPYKAECFSCKFSGRNAKNLHCALHNVILWQSAVTYIWWSDTSHKQEKNDTVTNMVQWLTIIYHFKWLLVITKCDSSSLWSKEFVIWLMMWVMIWVIT